jgi:putative toxin-antitoxin system antitoxin component (TIGR02293 family)
MSNTRFQTQAAAVVALLGGPAVIPQPVHNESDLLRVASAGVPIKAVRHLQRHMRLSDREISEMLTIPESALARHEQTQSNLTRDEAEKAIQLSAVVAHGLDVFENEADFYHWLQLENPALGGERPQALLSSAPGREQVREVLGRIQWGIFS